MNSKGKLSIPIENVRLHTVIYYLRIINEYSGRVMPIEI